MVCSTQARTDNGGSDAKRGCTDTATPDNPLIGAVQRERLRPKRLAQSLVIALICDAQFTRARIVCMDPARSRMCTNVVPSSTAVAGRVNDGRTAVYIDTVAGRASAYYVVPFRYRGEENYVSGNTCYNLVSTCTPGPNDRHRNN